MKTKSDLSNHIFTIVKKQEMTQDELAKKVGVKREYINRIINCKVTPTVPLGLRIAGALEKSVEDVFFLVS